METRPVGRTDLRVTELSFGCASLGNLYTRVEDADAQAVLERAWQHGIRYFDTAPHYGRGLSEARLGAFLKGRNRSDFVVSTKVGRLLSPGAQLAEADGFVDPLPNNVRYDYSGDGIEAAFEQSCERLGTARVDIVYVHDIGKYTHGREGNAPHMEALLGSGLERLQKLKTQGRIRAFGLGVNETAVCVEVMKHASLDVILLAGRLSLLDRASETEFLPLCAEAGTSLVLGGVFNSGILATGAVDGATYDYAPASAEVLDRVRRMQAQAEAEGIPLATAALQFGKRFAQVASILIGTGKSRSLDRNAAAFAAPVDRGAIERIAAAG